MKWFVVEQEHFTKNPVESAAQNAKEIRNMFRELMMNYTGRKYEYE